jgi:hypothetical protein
MRAGQAKSELSDANRRLVELMSEVGFGTVEGLQVRGGEPAFCPPPKVTVVLKLDGDGEPPVRASADVALKAPVVRLLRQLDRLGDGTVLSIEVRHGLPSSMRVAGRA